MNTYLISYDLVKDKDYKALHEKIRAYPDWAKIHKSFWAVRSEWTAEQVFDDLKTALDSDDKLLVGRSGSSAKWHVLGDEVDAWIRQNF